MDTTRQHPDHPDMVKSVSDMAVQFEPPYRPISVDEFDKMAELGIIGPDERVELVDGRIVPLEPMNPPHASIVARIADALHRRLSGHALIWQQLPIVVTDRSKPLPDVALVRKQADYYGTRLPGPADVIAVVEVSDTRLAFDRGEKLRLYAKAAIPEYWVVDVNARAIEVFREPHDLGYAPPAVAKPGDMVAFAAFADRAFAVEELVG
jgi:Uma2 family endonuclease